MKLTRNVCVRCKKPMKWTKQGMTRAVVISRTKNTIVAACTTHCHLNYLRDGEKRED
jgi:hypothetical protein